MLSLASLQLFAATVDAGSFAAAARRLRLSPSAVSRRVAQLERALGVPLLARTTRALSLTDDGRAFHDRCQRILEELREAEDAIARSAARPSGLLRVDAPVALGRTVIAPTLPRLLERHPDLRIALTLRNTFVDPVAEGIDVTVRMGRLSDSTLIARRLGERRILACAAPAYLRRHGRPRAPRDLARHACLGYLHQGRPDPFRFVAGEGTFDVEVDGPFHSDDAEALRDAAVAGTGIVALFDFVVAGALASGALVPVLEDHPLEARPVHALYAPNRHLLPKVRVFLDHLSEVLEGKRPRAGRRPAAG
ncbi:LysR family transcriptional regulator [Anaeromyxobacter sp. Red801]|uniref:LysR family transcriptional regulator n=1 Tax=Anaeromyxobacter sp. Red801 TaxID=3411632 RepID=UPI003B9FFFDD